MTTKLDYLSSITIIEKIIRKRILEDKKFLKYLDEMSCIADFKEITELKLYLKHEIEEDNNTLKKYKQEIKEYLELNEEINN